MSVQNRLIIGAVLISLVFASLLLVLLSTQTTSTIKSYSEEEFLNMVETERLAESIDLASVQRVHREGISLISISRWPEALTSCKEGVELLGEEYSLPNVLEHTRGKLRAAYFQRAQGSIDNAAKIYCSVLETRLNLYQKKIGTLD